MKLLSKEAEIELFLGLNILSAMPLFIPRLFTKIDFDMYLFLVVLLYFKFEIFGFLYRRKSLKHIRKLLNRIYASKSVFFAVLICAVLTDIALSKFFPASAPLLRSFEDPFEYGLPSKKYIPLLFSGVSFSYLGFLFFTLFKKFKNRFLRANCLSGFKKVVLYKLYSPIVFALIVVACEQRIVCESAPGDGFIPLLVLAIVLIIFFFTVIIPEIFFAIIITILLKNKKRKALTLKLTRIFREIINMITIFGLAVYVGTFI